MTRPIAAAHSWLLRRAPFARTAAAVTLALLGLPGGALGQWKQGDGDTFGGAQDYWGPLLPDMSRNLCGATGLLRSVIVVVCGFLFVWFLYKGGRGDHRAWKFMIIVALVATLVMSAQWWLRLLGLSAFWLDAQYWNVC